MTTSVFQGLSRQVDQRGPLPPMPAGMPRTWDQVLLNDNFDKGLQGWHTHTGQYPPTLSDHAFQGSNHSLRLATGPGNSSAPGASPSIFKRLSHSFDQGFFMFYGWYAFRGPAEHTNPGQLMWYIDHQKWDGSARSFSQLALRRQLGTSPQIYSPRWSVLPDQLPSVPIANEYVDIPGAGQTTFPATSGQGAVPGWNASHGNYFPVGLIMSCNDSDTVTPNVGFGRYWRAYVGNRMFDLSTLNTNYNVTDDGNGTKSGIGTAPGNGAIAPQVDTQFSGAPNSFSAFDGGLNVGLGVTNSNTFDDGCALFAGHVFACHYPVGTVFPTGVIN